MNSFQPIITIAIPTWNRATRLDRSLTELLEVIERSGIEKDILSILVSNNGSTDDSQTIIEKHRNIFRAKDITFDAFSFMDNEGFDQNLLNCYDIAKGKYVAFLSDDDNLYDSFLPALLNDIETCEPNIIYYNFNQEPYTKTNPFITKDKLYIENNVISPIVKLMHWPKLTSIVVKCDLDFVDSRSLPKLKYTFMHCGLALDIFLRHGRLLQSTEFVGYPDDDYRDHVEFPPYIVNYLADTIEHVIGNKNLGYSVSDFKINRVDPLITSLVYLGAAFRGRFSISTSLKRRLFETIMEEFAFKKIVRKNWFRLSVALFKFGISFFYFILRRIKIFR